MESYAEGDFITMTEDGYSSSDQSSDSDEDSFFRSENRSPKLKISPSTPDSPPEEFGNSQLFLKKLRDSINKDYENMTSTEDFKKVRSFASKLKIHGLDVKNDEWIMMENGEDYSNFTIRRNITLHIHNKLDTSRATASVLGTMIAGRLIFNTSFGEEVDEALNRVVDQISTLRKKEYLDSRKKKKPVVESSDSDSD